MSKIQKFVQHAIDIANDNSHGYDQINRWGLDYDCSSLVYTCAYYAGYNVPKSGTRYTGTILDHFSAAGFKVFKFDGNLNDLDYGDILLNVTSHVAIYIGNGQLVEASINEHGGIAGGQVGDQTGNEIHIGGVYNYPWDYVLTPPSESESESEEVQPVMSVAKDVWSYKNPKLESRDVYGILRGIRDSVNETNSRLTVLEHKINALKK